MEGDEFMASVAISTLGCKVNAYESESTAQALRLRGYQTVDFKEKADVYIIFTCAVTNTAASKSRQKIHQARRQNPDALVCAVGCYVQIQADQMAEQEKIDILVGSSGKDKLPQLIDEALRQRCEPIVELHDVRTSAEFEMLPLDEFEHQTRAYLKVQDGCNQFCAYCIIPYARGRERSLPLDEALKEARRLAQKHKEIVLAGIHTGRYGKDRDTSLCDLIRGMCEIEPLERIRISSIEITEITDELLTLMETQPKIARHLHIPLQAGCDATLKRMGRPYTTAQFMARVEEIRSRIDGISISTDLIVGFPQESDAEFAATMAFLKQIQFSFIHVFPFSPKTGTPAQRMSGQISSEVKKQRARQVGEFSRNSYYAVKSSWIGKDVDVIIETCENGVAFGHSSEYLPVQIDGEFASGQRIVARCTHMLGDQLAAQAQGGQEK